MADTGWGARDERTPTSSGHTNVVCGAISERSQSATGHAKMFVYAASPF